MIAVLGALAGLALAVCLVDLVLTLGVVRRLREHTELISKLASPAPVAMLADGRTVRAFEAVATTGEAVSRDLLSGVTLVGAFAPDCPACTEALPAFVDHAERFPGGRRQVIAVVMADGNDTEAYRADLEPVARVVVEAGPGGIGEALGITSFPAFGVLDAAGTLVSSGYDLDRLAVPAGV